MTQSPDTNIAGTDDLFLTAGRPKAVGTNSCPVEAGVTMPDSLLIVDFRAACFEFRCAAHRLPIEGRCALGNVYVNDASNFHGAKQS
jgi:hypothetical protein